MKEKEQPLSSEAGTTITAQHSICGMGRAATEGSWMQKPRRWPTGPAAQPGRIDVFAVTLDSSPQAVRSMRATLSAAELRRADRFHFPHHRDRFITARGLLRTILSQYVGADASKLEFGYSAHGKPELTGSFAESALRFNVSHCENLALIALTNSRRIGVDLERIRLLPDMGELVTRFFSLRESKAFHALPEAQKPEAFFNLWTRKEAWLKATGQGISHYLAEVEVSFLPGEAAQVLHLPQSIGSQGAWSLHDLRPSKEFVGAVAIEGPVASLYCWRWEFAAATEQT